MKVEVGDIVLVEMKVGAVKDVYIRLDCQDNRLDYAWVNRKHVKEVLKRDFQPGDKVTWSEGFANQCGVILCIHEKMAWVDTIKAGPTTILLDHIRRIA